MMHTCAIFTSIKYTPNLLHFAFDSISSHICQDFITWFKQVTDTFHMFYSWILHYRNNPLMNLKIFATVHSLVNYTTLIDSCQAHLTVQRASNIELTRQKWHWCCDNRVARAKQASCLFSWLSVFKPARPLFHFSLRLNR